MQFRETLAYMHPFMIKGMTEDADKQLDEETRSVRSGRVPIQELLSPWSRGAWPSWMWKCPPTQTVGIFTWASSHRHGQLLTPFPAALLSPFSKKWTKEAQFPSFESWLGLSSGQP